MQLITEIISFFKRLLFALHDGFSQKAKDREAVMLMVEWANRSKRYRDALSIDHEPNEVSAHMKLIEPLLWKASKRALYPDMVLTLSSCEFIDLQGMFFQALEYCEEFYQDRVDRVSMTAKFYRCFCKSKEQIEAECLKACIAGDFELEAALKQLLK